jgi:radical SAM superfamily enzyme YgiQ (UPF0313 family)
MTSSIRYEQPVIRPPSEADALILQATLGCSHNRCAFCFTYADKRFRARSREELLAEIEWAGRELGGQVRKVFLADGDALALSTGRLAEILERLRRAFPRLRRVSAYATPGNFARKSVAELEQLRRDGLVQLYVGFESGDDEILRRVDKGVTHDEMVELCRKPVEAGIKLSATIVLGLGGPRLSARHAGESARLIDEIRPRFASALSLMLEPGSDRYPRRFGDPSWRELTPREYLEELRMLVAAVEADGVIFRANHASNFLPLGGTFQKGKARMLDEIDEVLGDPELAGARPDFMRLL